MRTCSSTLPTPVGQPELLKINVNAFILIVPHQKLEQHFLLFTAFNYSAAGYLRSVLYVKYFLCMKTTSNFYHLV